MPVALDAVVVDAVVVDAVAAAATSSGAAMTPAVTTNEATAVGTISAETSLRRTSETPACRLRTSASSGVRDGALCAVPNDTTGAD